MKRYVYNALPGPLKLPYLLAVGTVAYGRDLVDVVRFVVGR